MLLEELLLKYKKHRKNIVIYFSVLSTDSRKNQKNENPLILQWVHDSISEIL